MTRRRLKKTFTSGDEVEPNAVGLSGWLFTDLLLGLLVVFAAVALTASIGDDDEQVLRQEIAEKSEAEVVAPKSTTSSVPSSDK